MTENSYLCVSMEARDYMDLLELQLRIKEGIAEAFPGKCWVKAEITSWSPRSNGHCYLTLSQTRGGKAVAESRAMIWSWHYPRIAAFFREETGQELHAGLTVLLRVQVSFSELYGVSLFIDDIDPAFTLGEKALERRRTIEKLTAEGYMELQRELALPELPYALAVISSPTAAGYQDFCKHLTQSPEGYAFRIELFEALMQGEQAPASMAAALKQAQESGCDAILILRGGGSELDLSCFDDYGLAVAIALCPLPVITAVGHDKDVHVADMVANASVKTPTALADLFLDAYRAADEKLDRLEQRVHAGVRQLLGRAELTLQAADDAIRRNVRQRLSQTERQLDGLQVRIRIGLARKAGAYESLLQRAAGRVSRGLLHKYTEVERQVQGAGHRLRFAASARVSQEVSALALREARIASTDPRNILALGYVLVTGRDRKVLKSAERVAVGDRIGVRFADGALSARVEEVYSETVDNNQVNIA